MSHVSENDLLNEHNKPKNVRYPRIGDKQHAEFNQILKRQFEPNDLVEVFDYKR